MEYVVWFGFFTTSLAIASLLALADTTMRLRQKVMTRNSIYTFFGLTMLLAIGLPATPSFGQTMQQIRTCQGKGTNDIELMIRACSVFIDTRRAVGGGPLPKNALGGFLEGRGSAYTNKGDYDRAIADYTRAIELNILNFQYEFYYNRGNAYYGKKDYARAIADFDESIRLNSRVALPYINRGNVRARNRDYAKAIADYTKALSIDPKNVLANTQLQRARLALATEEKWMSYLRTIQDDGDYANWSGPPLEVFQKPK
jgi:tetratricopeptide (TPR) repeat protein